MIHVVVEREYDTPFNKKDWYAADLCLFPCLTTHHAKWIRSQISLDGRRTICEYEAPDAESIRIAYRTANITFKRIWSAQVVEPGQDPSDWLEQPHRGVNAAEQTPPS